MEDRILHVKEIVPPTGTGVINVSRNYFATEPSSTLDEVIINDNANPLPAYAVVNSHIKNTGATGNISLPMPEAADVFAEFARRGVTLKIGDCWKTMATSVNAFSISFDANGWIGVTDWPAVVPPRKSAELVFTVLAIPPDVDADWGSTILCLPLVSM